MGSCSILSFQLWQSSRRVLFFTTTTLWNKLPRRCFPEHCILNLFMSRATIYLFSSSLYYLPYTANTFSHITHLAFDACDRWILVYINKDTLLLIRDICAATICKRKKLNADFQRCHTIRLWKDYIYLQLLNAITN